MKNHYATLHVAREATPEALKSAYRRLAREVHPDRNPAGAERFAELAAAYAVLSDPVRRAAYDAELARWLQAVGATACPTCGAANRVPPFQAEQRAVCGRCKGDLGLEETARRSAVREALLHHAALVVDDVGGEVLSMAHEALRTGLGRLRRRWGLRK